MKSEKLYQKYSNGRHWENHPTVYAETFAKFLKEVGFGGLLVDIGCGNGRDVDCFVKMGFRSIGVDNKTDEVALSRKNYPELTFEVQDVEKLKLADNSVDAFYMINVIHYVDKEKAISEIVRALKPNGYFFVHFNIEISDKTGKVDYSYKLEDVAGLTAKFSLIDQVVFERTDYVPVEHKHKVLELIIQKPS
ncbi:MAG: methyltransferase domain-containing protein [Patescibacteria group bacterium]|jgi:SAM-dependent methyltransferase